jgi:uncharacterized protein (TIGR00299 family) protein
LIDQNLYTYGKHKTVGKIVYLDCPTGIAGDMCLGALVDVGVPIAVLRQGLDRLGIADQYRLRVERVLKNDQAATKVHVELRDRPSDAFLTEGEGGQLLPSQDLSPDPHHSHHHHTHDHDHHHDHPQDHGPHHHPHDHDHDPDQGHSHTAEHHHTHGRTLPEIEAMITAAALPDRVQRWSLAVFRRLAQAESDVHGVAPEAVHFHEVGGIDAIVDIVGTCIGLDWLDVEAVYCSVLPTGGGTVWAAHGRMPVPVPAVLKLWQMRRVPVYDNGIERELVTPTGAALMVELAAEFGKPPAMVIDRVGWGAGTIDLSLPNSLRLWVGETVANPAVSPIHPELETQSLGTSETVAVLETQIDDLSPQAIGYVFDCLFAVGALDVFTTPIGMKKSRPGLALTVICAPELQIACETIIFRETTTLGIRHRLQLRTTLARELTTIDLDGQAIAIKIARDRTGAIVNLQPEYEDVARAARATGQSWLEVQRSVLRQYGHTVKP